MHFKSSCLGFTGTAGASQVPYLFDAVRVVDAIDVLRSVCHDFSPRALLRPGKWLVSTRMLLLFAPIRVHNPIHPARNAASPSNLFLLVGTASGWR